MLVHFLVATVNSDTNSQNAGIFPTLIEFTWDYPANEEDPNSTIMLILRDSVGQPSIPSEGCK